VLTSMQMQINCCCTSDQNEIVSFGGFICCLKADEAKASSQTSQSSVEIANYLSSSCFFCVLSMPDITYMKSEYIHEHMCQYFSSNYLLFT